MTMPSAPGSGRGQPPLEQAAADTLQGLRGQPRRFPPGYEPHPLAPDEKKEAEKAKPQLCTFCAGVHPMASTAACPRLATFELDGEGHVKSGTYWPGTKWARGRVVLAEDLEEEDDDADD